MVEGFKEWFESGEKYRSQNMFDKAIDCYYKALEIDIRDITCWYNIGLCYMQMGQFDRATYCFDSILNSGIEHEFFAGTSFRQKNPRMLLSTILSNAREYRQQCIRQLESQNNSSNISVKEERSLADSMKPLGPMASTTFRKMYTPDEKDVSAVCCQCGAYLEKGNVKYDDKNNELCKDCYDSYSEKKNNNNNNNSKCDRCGNWIDRHYGIKEVLYDDDQKVLCPWCYNKYAQSKLDETNRTPNAAIEKLIEYCKSKDR